ncbi:hypothetical protein E3N88_08014 [Mikania micrantha]|uniref:Integrase catalytic domain-containing protein n=1 Tax=Mikania micrantha TaxID=192012 RepID=A0A5N6PF18_9ASTR|nr:hypothetical protein E3N88_08014 [Mikania micrantha]
MALTDDNSSNNHLWFLDSGCSNHMTGLKNSFLDLDETFKLEVNLGNKKKLQVEGKGTVKVQLHGDACKLLGEVYYAPRLEYNHLSVGQLMKKGYTLIFDEDKCTITNKVTGADLMSIKVSKNNMFLLDASKAVIDKTSVNSACNAVSKLWHLRYGHLHFHGLKLLADKGLVRGLPPITSLSTCEGCILGKHHKQSFTSSSWKASKKLELVHADLCGPMQSPSLGGNLYYFLLIDDFSRMSWIYFLKRKSEAFEKFKAFKSLVERESDCLIKVLRTNGGGEFTSQEFNSFCTSHGIKREITIPHTPQHNGTVERKNRTIMGLARSMLKEKHRPNYLWAESVATAIYLINRSPTKAIADQVPAEVWSGRKPSVYHLRVFGCIAFSHVPAQERRKLDNRAERCIFLGYSQQSAGYRLYNPVTRRFLVQKSVVFMEENQWDWSKDSSTEKVPYDISFTDPFPANYVDQDNDNSLPSLPSVQESTPTPQEPINSEPTTTPTTISNSHAPNSSNVTQPFNQDPGPSRTLGEEVFVPPGSVPDNPVMLLNINGEELPVEANNQTSFVTNVHRFLVGTIELVCRLWTQYFPRGTSAEEGNCVFYVSAQCCVFITNLRHDDVP